MGIRAYRKALWLLLFALAAPSLGMAATIRVPGDQPTIQAGINAAASVGDTVLVALGTYAGTDNKNLNLKGKAIVLASQSGLDSTIIDCENDGRAFYFQAGEGPSTIIEGLSIVNGFVSGIFPDGWGGGILCIGCSPTFLNCRVSDCEADNGGGIALYDSSPNISDCIITGNRSPGGSGGGGYFYQSSPVLHSCVIESNSASQGGGMMNLVGATPQLMNCSINDNDATSVGGGICFLNSTSGAVSDCVISGNGAIEGGGVYAQGANPLFLNCELRANGASGGGGVYSNSASPSFTNCSFIENTAGQGAGMHFLCCPEQSPIVSGCTFADNAATDRGGAIGCTGGAEPLLSHCVFVSNEASFGGSAFWSNGGNQNLEHCSFYGNRSFSGTIRVDSDTVRVFSSIVSFSPNGEAVRCAGGVAIMACTDIYANLGGNWTECIASQLGQNGNFSANPLFCDAADRDLRIRATSPCAPANSPPGCGLIGALPVGCGVADVAAGDAPSADLRLTVIPNPVRGMARFEIGPVTSTTLSIFDSQGRLVEQLMRQDGHWKWTPGTSVPAGVYFARPESGTGAGAAVKFLYLR